MGLPHYGHVYQFSLIVSTRITILCVKFFLYHVVHPNDWMPEHHSGTAESHHLPDLIALFRYVAVDFTV